MINRYNPEYYQNQRAHWKEVKRKLFGSTIPAEHEWTDLSEILSVLNEIAQDRRFNHIYLPSGGFSNLRASTLSDEPKSIVLGLTSEPSIAPRSLTFYGYSSDEFDHFRLITGVNKESMELGGEKWIQTLNQLRSLDFSDLESEGLNLNQNGGERPKPVESPSGLNQGAPSGDYIISCPVSPINQLMFHHPTIHQDMGVEGYKKLIEKVVEELARQRACS